MRIFKDENGQPWKIAINIGTVKAVRALTGVDLVDIKDGTLFNELGTDPVKLGDVLWVLCMDEAKERGVDELAFAKALAGDALAAASDAMLEELIDFFPRPQRELLRKALNKGREVQERTVRKAGEDLDAALAALDGT